MDAINSVFLSVLSLSVMSSIIAIIIILTRKLLKDFINPKFYMMLWAIVLIRMIVPYMPESRISVFNLFSNNVGEITYTNSQNIIVPKESTNNIQIQPNHDNTLKTTNNNKLLQNSKGIENLEVTYKNAATPNEVPVKKSVKIDYMSVLSLIWFVVMSLSILVVVILNMRFFIVSRKYVEKKDLASMLLLEKCKKILRIKRNIRIFIIPDSKSPFIASVINPKVYIPQRLVESIEDEQLKFVLMHELTHYKKGDVLLNYFICMLTIIHWFNPILWFVCREINRDRELACDNRVLEALDESESISYAMTLLNLAKCYAKNRPFLSFASFCKTKKQIERRIDMINNFKKGSYKFSAFVVILCISLGSVLLTDAHGGKHQSNNVKNKIAEKVSAKVSTWPKEKNDSHKITYKFPENLKNWFPGEVIPLMKGSELYYCEDTFFDNNKDSQMILRDYMVTATEEEVRAYLDNALKGAVIVPQEKEERALFYERLFGQKVDMETYLVEESRIYVEGEKNGLHFHISARPFGDTYEIAYYLYSFDHQKRMNTENIVKNLPEKLRGIKLSKDMVIKGLYEVDFINPSDEKPANGQFDICISTNQDVDSVIKYFDDNLPYAAWYDGGVSGFVEYKSGFQRINIEVRNMADVKANHLNSYGQYFYVPGVDDGQDMCTLPTFGNGSVVINISCADNKLYTETEVKEELGIEPALTYEDQVGVELAIKDFSKAIEKGDYEAAAEFCTSDFKEYLINLYTGNGVVADGFSAAVIDKIPLKFVSTRGYYYDETGTPNYNISIYRPTLTFNVTFEYIDKDGEKQSAGGYVYGAQEDDGKWVISGFSSSL